MHALTDWAHDKGALAIALVNPTTLAVLEPPGKWGTKGADIAVGEGQPLGAPMASGGPYFGFMCCRQDFVRQMPGRIVGRTVDLDGKPGFALTLQAREQHIRRSKATSNICTNQGLVVTAATQYMALLGPQGLAKVASNSHANTVALADKLTAIPNVTRAFASPCGPSSDMYCVAAVTTRPWLVQMLEVALERRMCCSRACRVRVKPGLPSRSTVRPTIRPGICRTKSWRQHMKPK